MKSTNHLRHGDRLEFRIFMYAFVFGLSLTQSTCEISRYDREARRALAEKRGTRGAAKPHFRVSHRE